MTAAPNPAPRDCVAKALAYRDRQPIRSASAGAAVRPRGAPDVCLEMLPPGFVAATLVETTPQGELQARRTVLGTAQASFERVYAERMHHLTDPVLSEMLRSTDAFFWSELPKRRGRLTNSEHRVLRDAEKFGFLEGYVIPDRDPRTGGLKALVFYAVRLLGQDAEVRHILEHLAVTMSPSLCTEAKARNVAASRPRILRSRQIECLHWAALGKTSTEIGMILGLSRKTVDEHVENACRTFGVNGRIQAVARAIDVGLIEIQ